MRVHFHQILHSSDGTTTEWLSLHVHYFSPTDKSGHGNQVALVGAILPLGLCHRNWDLLFLNSTTPIPFWILGVPYSELVIAKDSAAIRPATTGCFCHISLVKLFSGSNTVNCWHPSAISEIKRASSLWYPDSAQCSTYAVKSYIPVFLMSKLTNPEEMR